MNILHERLQACNVTKYCFVNGSTDQYSPVILDTDIHVVPDTDTGVPASAPVPVLERTPYTETQFLNPIHVKTLIWKGVYIHSNSLNNNNHNNNNNTNHNNGNNLNSQDKNSTSNSATQLNQPFYFVTALRIQDKVDVKSLRSLVRREWPRKKGSSGMLLLQMAEREIAEELTGFKSGSMPPGWHSVPMTLFIDDYIIDDANLLMPSSSTVPATTAATATSTMAIENGEEVRDVTTELNGLTINNNNHENQESKTNFTQYSNIIMSVGSGTEDYSLHVSLQDLFNSSTYHHYNKDNDDHNDDHNDNHNDNSDNSEMKKSTFMIQQYEQDSRFIGQHMGKHICSFSRAKVEEMTKAKRKQQEEYSRMQKDGKEQSKDQRNNHNSNNNNKQTPKELNRRNFNTAARRPGKTQLVKSMIEKMGDKFPSFMKIDEPDGDNRFAGELNKNALHYAAWKGDLETITLLINTAKQYNDDNSVRDLVNIISTGEGNFGKSPIFYSITQCQDDAVLLLLSHGANLLIVNNKGQTPCSLAVNKLNKQTCEFMFQMEKDQLEAGGTFSDYRASHSDGKRYGDIDPRFIRAGDVNVDEAILKEIGINSSLADLSSIDLKTVSLPRSVRVTTALIRLLKWSKGKEKALNEKIQLESSETVNINNDETSKRDEKEQPVNGDKVKTEKVIKYKTSSNTIAKLADGTELDISKLQKLSLYDVLSSTSEGNQRAYELVDDEAGLVAFQFAVDEATSHLNDNDEFANDHTFVQSSWGLDCEWRPSHISGEESPIAILQISSRSRSFVIDVQTLLQNGIKDDTTDLTPVESILSDTLGKLFGNTSIGILGFGIGQDLSKLVTSFPHVPCFREFNSVIDLQSLSRHLYPGTPKHFMSSLQKAVAILLGKRLDKTEQCSVWDNRPLNDSQLEYASLDATVLPKLLEKVTERNSIVKKEDDYYFRKNSFLLTSFRFQPLVDNNDTAFRVQMGSIKMSMKVKYARQIWPTFKKSPALPELIPLHEQALQAASRPVRIKEKKPPKDKRSKRNPISVSVLTGDLQNLPTPGITLGYTKDSVIERVVRKQVIDSLPENAYLQYNRRGGIIELGNTFLLFVNFGVGRIHHKYRNEFLSEGKLVTFTINQSRYEDTELLQSLLTPGDEAMYFQKPALFFIRASTKDKFMFCGKATYSQHEEKDGDLIDLVLQLTNFKDLVDSSNNSDGETKTYMDIVAAQESLYNDDL